MRKHLNILYRNENLLAVLISVLIWSVSLAMLYYVATGDISTRIASAQSIISCLNTAAG